MNLQPIKPNTHNKGWLVACCECNQAKDVIVMFADLDRPWHYVCFACASQETTKGVNNG